MRFRASDSVDGGLARQARLVWQRNAQNRANRAEVTQIGGATVTRAKTPPECSGREL